MRSKFVIPLGTAVAAVLLLPTTAVAAEPTPPADSGAATAAPTAASGSTATPDPSATASSGATTSPTPQPETTKLTKAQKKAAKKAAKKAKKKAKKAALKAKKAAAKAKKAAQAAKYDDEKVSVRFSPGDSGKYGVGQLVTADFSRSIIRKGAAERAITVKSKKKLPPGRWGWIDDDTAVYRPKRFWPGNALIKFKADLRGVVLGKDGDTRYVGSSDSVYRLRTARKLVLRIRDDKHRLYVERNDKTVKSFPVSLGKADGGYRTRSGIKILTGEKYSVLRMTGTDRNTGETWDVMSPYSIRLTPTGEFIHGAPWAYHRMGIANGSHGCTNMYIGDAKWLYNRVMRGDPTVTRGTGRPMEVTNGTPGAYWNYSWKAWKAKSYR